MRLLSDGFVITDELRRQVRAAYVAAQKAGEPYPVPHSIVEQMLGPASSGGNLAYGPVRTLVDRAVYECAVELHHKGEIKLAVYKCPYCKTVEIPFASNLDDDSFWESHETFGIRRCVEPGMVELCASCAHFTWPITGGGIARHGSHGRCRIKSPGGGGYDNCCQTTNGCKSWMLAARSDIE